MVCVSHGQDGGGGSGSGGGETWVMKRLRSVKLGDDPGIIELLRRVCMVRNHH